MGLGWEAAYLPAGLPKIYPWIHPPKVGKHVFSRGRISYITCISGLPQTRKSQWPTSQSTYSSSWMTYNTLIAITSWSHTMASWPLSRVSRWRSSLVVTPYPDEKEITQVVFRLWRPARNNPKLVILRILLHPGTKAKIVSVARQATQMVTTRNDQTSRWKSATESEVLSNRFSRHASNARRTGVRLCQRETSLRSKTETNSISWKVT
jgi:hypothetical protein